MSRLLLMSLYGSAMIVMIAVVRRLFQNRFSKGFFKVLWLLTALRMTVPFFAEIQIKSYSPKRLWDFSIIQNEVPVSDNVNYGGVFSAQYLQADISEGNLPLILWSIGFTAMFTYFVFLYIVSIRKFSQAENISSFEAEHIINSFSLKRKVRLRAADIGSPLTYGIIYPKILLPKDFGEYDDEQMKYIILHEMTHIRNFDALFKPLIIAALCLHWFNPLAWVMFALSNRDIELSCDESVIGKCGADKREYAIALIKFKSGKASHGVFYNFGRSVMEERIECIMKNKKTSQAALIWAACITAAVIAAFSVKADFNTVMAAKNELPVSVTDGDESDNGIAFIPYETVAGVETENSSLKTANDFLSGSIVIRQVDESEFLYGETACDFLKGYFDEGFFYPVDTKYVNNFFYYGAFSVPAELGAEVYSMAEGTVLCEDYSSALGNYIIMDYGGDRLFLYAHLKSLEVSAGDKVASGELIAAAGDTGYTYGCSLLIYKIK